MCTDAETVGVSAVCAQLHHSTAHWPSNWPLKVIGWALMVWYDACRASAVFCWGAG